MNGLLSPALADRIWIDAVGWMLVHFVWQAAAVATVVWIALASLRHASSRGRYAVACSGLILMAAVPLLTFGWRMHAGFTDSRFDSTRERRISLRRRTTGCWTLSSFILAAPSSRA